MRNSGTGSEVYRTAAGTCCTASPAAGRPTSWSVFHCLSLSFTVFHCPSAVLLRDVPCQRLLAGAVGVPIYVLDIGKASTMTNETLPAHIQRGGHTHAAPLLAFSVLLPFCNNHG